MMERNWHVTKKGEASEVDKLGNWSVKCGIIHAKFSIAENDNTAIL